MEIFYCLAIGVTALLIGQLETSAILDNSQMDLLLAQFRQACPDARTCSGEGSSSPGGEGQGEAWGGGSPVNPGVQDTPGHCCSCQCSADCWLYGTCCPDKETPTANADEIRPECISARFGESPVSSRRNYMVIRSCPANTNDELIVSQCLQSATADDIATVAGTVFVTDVVSNRIYANSYCALCHGSDTWITWDIYTDCLGPWDSTDSDSRIQQALSMECSLVFIHPETSMRNVDRCYPRSSSVAMTACNVTGLWRTDLEEEGRREVEQGCHDVTTPYQPLGSSHIYANVYCFLCNVGQGEMASDGCEAMDDSDIDNLHLLRQENTETVTPGSESSVSSNVQTSVSTASTVKAGECISTVTVVNTGGTVSHVKTESATNAVRTSSIVNAGPSTNAVDTSPPIITESATIAVDTSLPIITESATNAVDKSPPIITESATNAVDTSPPIITESATNAVDMSHPIITESATNAVDTSPRIITESATNAVDTSPPIITESATNAVDKSPPTITESTTNAVDTSPPIITESATNAVDISSSIITGYSTDNQGTFNPIKTSPLYPVSPGITGNTVNNAGLTYPLNTDSASPTNTASPADNDDNVRATTTEISTTNDTAVETPGPDFMWTLPEDVGRESCLSDEMMDPFTDTCRRIHCPLEVLAQDGSCEVDNLCVDIRFVLEQVVGSDTELDSIIRARVLAIEVVEAIGPLGQVCEIGNISLGEFPASARDNLVLDMSVVTNGADCSFRNLVQLFENVMDSGNNIPIDSTVVGFVYLSSAYISFDYTRPVEIATSTDFEKVECGRRHGRLHPVTCPAVKLTGQEYNRSVERGIINASATVFHLDSGLYVCLDDYLGNVALAIWDEWDEERPQDPLRLVQIMLSTISAVCLLFTVLAKAILRHLVNEQSKIAILVCFNLVLFHIMSMIGQEYRGDDNGCHVIGIIKHALVLSSSFSLALYMRHNLCIVKQRSSSEGTEAFGGISRKVVRQLVPVYLLALVVVGIHVLVSVVSTKFSGLGYEGPDCTISSLFKQAVFVVLPLGIVFLLNIVLGALMQRELRKMRVNNPKVVYEKSQTNLMVFATFVMLLAWISKLLYETLNELFLVYVFHGLNCLVSLCLTAVFILDGRASAQQKQKPQI